MDGRLGFRGVQTEESPQFPRKGGHRVWGCSEKLPAWQVEWRLEDGETGRQHSRVALRSGQLGPSVPGRGGGPSQPALAETGPQNGGPPHHSFMSAPLPSLGPPGTQKLCSHLFTLSQAGVGGACCVPVLAQGSGPPPRSGRARLGAEAVFFWSRRILKLQAMHAPPVSLADAPAP